MTEPNPCQRCGSYVLGTPDLCPHCASPFDGRPRLGTRDRPYVCEPDPATSDHSDIDALALPSKRPAKDAPILALLWFAVRQWWAGVRLLPWVTVRDTGINRYQEHARTGERRVQTDRGAGYQPIDKGWLAGGAWLDPSKIRPPRSPSAVSPPRPRGAERLTLIVTDALDTPIPKLDELAAAIQADRDDPGGRNVAAFHSHNRGLSERLLHSLCTAPPHVTADEIFADLGIDPDPSKQSSAMWASVRKARQAKPPAPNPTHPSPRPG